MLLEPKDIFEKLEFDKILELLEKECYGDLGKEKVRTITPDVRKFMIERKLKEADEFKLSLIENDNIPIGAYNDISKEVKMLEVVDFVLPEEGLQRINVILLAIRNIYKFFTNTRKDIYATLFDIIKEVSFDEALLKAIQAVIDEEGNIRPNASPELMRIRNKIGGKQKELDKQFRSIINNYRNKGWLTDSVESFRNGRRVLSVPSEHKRKIRGIIHDESTTGKTAFIEPEAIIDINNDIFDLETEEKREIYRILKELSAMLRPYTPLLKKYQDIIIRYDVIQAKARLANRMNACLPILKGEPHLGIKTAYHPLLFLKNKELNKKTVPFTLELYGKNRMLVLSGPNAGGKSITMKSVGLIQLMLQSGLLIPVDPLSEMGIYEKIFADIGDQQSIEDDLSTYSSRLKNMKAVLEEADETSLVLIDEFGSGTDPKIGGAIAEAIMRELNFKKVYGVITTHYSNLKIFAFKNKGIVNASMHFDKEGLTPTYELKVGRPGSSYAFEIAEKSGLNKKVLKYAKHRAGKNEKAVDELLIDLQREKKEVEEKLAGMAAREKKLEKLIKNYEELHKELVFKRKKLKLTSKEAALQQTQRDNKEFEKLIREIKEEKNLEKAKELAAKVRKERGALTEDVSGLKEDIYYKESKVQKPIEVGDFVKLKTGSATGKVKSIKKGKAIVMMGIMTMTVHLNELQHANEPLEIRSKKGVNSDVINSTAKFESKIDIRGLRRDEALKTVEMFVDKALMSSANSLRIVHGKGDGILRRSVIAKLREYDGITRIFHPEHNDGGDGVTIVEMD